MQTLTPTAVRLNNLSGSAADLDDSPDAPDGSWCTRLGWSAWYATPAVGTVRMVGAAPSVNLGGDSFLSWSAVSGASGYNVYWDTVGGPPYANVVDVGNVTSADQGDFTGLGTGTRYFNITSYQVGAGDAKNEGPWGTEITVVVA